MALSVAHLQFHCSRRVFHALTWFYAMPHYVPWTPEEDKLLGTASDRLIATRLSRSRAAVMQRRRRLNIAGFKSLTISLQGNWGATELTMLGCYPDDEVATITGRGLKEVQAKRKALHRSKSRGGW
jgi:hypothetical protein